MKRTFLEEFLVRIGYDVDKKSEQEAGDSIKNISDAVENFGNIVRTVAGAAVLGSLWQGLTTTADKFDQLADAANRIGNGLRASELSSFAYAVQLTGSSAEAALSGIEQLSRAIGQASLGMGRAKEVFKQLNIDVKNSDGTLKSAVEVWGELSAKMRDMDRAAQTGIITRLGLSADLVEALTSDLSELQQQYADTYRRAGISIDEVAEKSAAFNDGFDMLKMTIEAVRDAIGARFLERGRLTFDSLRRIIYDNMPRIIELVSGFITAIAAIGKAFAITAGVVLKIVDRFLKWFNDLDRGWKIAMLSMAAAWIALNSAFIRSPLGILLSLAAAIGLLIDDFKTWEQGGKSLIDWNGRLGKTILWLVNSPIAKFIASFAAIALIVVKFLNPLGTLIGLLRAFSVALNLGGGALKGILLVARIFASALAGLGNILISLATKIFPLLMQAALRLGAALLTTPIGWLMAGIALLIGAGYLLYKNWDKISAAVSMVWDQACEKISGWAQTIQDIWSGVFDWFAEKFGWIIDGAKSIANKAGELWDGAADKISDLFSFGDNEDSNALLSAMADTSGALNTVAAPPAMSSNSTNNQSFTQNNGDVNITIEAAQNPQETAQQIADIQQRVRSDQIRNMRRGMQ